MLEYTAPHTYRELLILIYPTIIMRIPPYCVRLPISSGWWVSEFVCVCVCVCFYVTATSL